MLEVGRRPPKDAYWCPPMAVSLEEMGRLWRDTNLLERWAHEGWVERGFDVLWDFDRNCWCVIV